MNFISRTITGSVFILLGLASMIFAYLYPESSPSLFYGVPVFIIGFFIFFNKTEDKIEERKDLNKSGNK